MVVHSSCDFQAHIFDGVGHIDHNLHAGLHIQGDQRFRGAVVLGIGGGEDNPVHLLAVVRGKGSDGGLCPGEGALHRDVIVGCGAGQLHIGQGAAVRNVLLALGIDSGGGDGEGCLRNLQDDLPGSAGDVVIIIGEGDGDPDIVGHALTGYHGIADLFSLHRELPDIHRAGLIRFHAVPHKVFHCFHAGEISDIHGVFIRHGIQRRLQDLFQGNGKLPVGRVAALAHGACGNGHIPGRLGEVRTGPAKEGIAAAGGTCQGDGFTLDGVGIGVGSIILAAKQVVVNAVAYRFPNGGQNHISGGAGGEPCIEGIVAHGGRFHHPAQAGIAIPGGMGKVDPVTLDGVGVGVGGVVGAAFQLVGDGVLNSLPAGVQRHVTFHQVGFQVNPISFIAFRCAEPAQEFIADARRRFGGILFCQLTDKFGGGMEGLLVLAVVEHIGQRGVFQPISVEGHAAGEHVAVEVHLFAGVILSQIPAVEYVALGHGDDQIQHGLSQALGGIGVARILGLIVGEDQLVGSVGPIVGSDTIIGNQLAAGFSGIIGRNALLTAEVHGDVHPPVGIQRDVAAQLLGDVEGFALAFGIVEPAGEGQTLHSGILRHDNAAIVRRIHTAIQTHVVVVVQASDLVALHAIQLDGHIMSRHGEGDRIAVGGIAQSLRLGGKTQDIILTQQVGREDNLIAGSDGVHLGGLMAQDRPGIQTVRIGNGERSGDIIQRQDDLTAFLASGDGQTGFNGCAAAALQQNRECADAVKGRTVHSQRPEVLLILHRHKVHHFSGAADAERGVCRCVGGVDEIGNLSGIAVDVHSHIHGGCVVAGLIGGGEDHGMGESAHFVQHGGRILPGNGACYGSHAVSGNSIHHQRDIAQLAAIGDGVLHSTLDGRVGTGDGHGIAGRGIGNAVLAAHIALDFTGRKFLQRDGGSAGDKAGLGQNSAGNVQGDAVDSLAGIHIGGIEGALPCRQRTTGVGNGIGCIQHDPHTDLGIHGNQNFRGAVIGTIGGGEQNLIHFHAVIRALGNDGGIRPPEGTLNGGAVGDSGTIQRHIGKRGVVRNIAAACGIAGRSRDGDGVLGDRQGDVLISGNGIAGVIRKGDGESDGVGIACGILHSLADLGSSYGEPIQVIRADCIRSQSIQSKGLHILDSGEIIHAHGVGTRDSRQRSIHNAANGVNGCPVGFVGAIAGGACGDHHIHGRPGESGTRPAGESVAIGSGIGQHNGFTFNGILDGVGNGRFTADKIVGDGVNHGLPLCGKGDISCGAGGNGNSTVGCLDSGHFPTQEGIALAGGFAEENVCAFNVVRAGVGRVIHAAAQLIGDGVLRGLPAGVQRCGPCESVGIEVNRSAAIRCTGPARKFVVLALGSFGNVLKQHAHMLDGHGVRFLLLAIVQLVGHNGNLLPAGVEGHAAGERILGRIHRLAGAVGGEIPAVEIMAIVIGDNDLQSILPQLLGGIGEFAVITLVAGEDQRGISNFHNFAVDFRVMAAGDISRRSLGAAKVHGDIGTPIGVQGDVVADLLGKVEGFTLAGGIVIPARERQALDIRIGRYMEAVAILGVDAEIGFQLAVVVLVIHLILPHAADDNLGITGRHGEGHGVAVDGVIQALWLGGEAQTVITFL